MGRPLPNDHQVARKLVMGALDPSGLGLAFEIDGAVVSAAVDASALVASRARVVPPGPLQAAVDDAAHAGAAAIRKRVGVTREVRARYLKPLYGGDRLRIDATLHKEAGDLLTLLVRIVNGKDQLCVEAEVEIFALGLQQVKSMAPGGQVPAELLRLLP